MGTARTSPFLAVAKGTRTVQVGTIAEALGCFEYAAQNAILAIPSGRSGERIEKLNFLLRAAEGIPNCALADVPVLVRF
jgi:enolase